MYVVQLHHALQINLPPALVPLRVCVLSFASLPQYRAWVDGVLFAHAEPSLFAHTHFLSDESLQVYRAYGLGRNRWWRVYGPRIVWHYVKRYVQRQQLPKIRQDVLQRGGDFVIGADGRVRFAYVGKDQADRPPIERLLAAC